MNLLQKFAHSQHSWALEEFVEVTNVLLPQFLPEEKTNTRVREEVTSRLVRHYATLNMLDEPLKEGREARYTYRHLLQVLVVRRLLAEGYTAGAIDKLATISSNSELEALLQGGVQISITPANPALAFLQKIQQRPVNPQHWANSNVKPLTPSSQWTRLEIVPGLEIHVREDFRYPNSPQEQQNLLEYLSQRLAAFSK